MSRRPLLASSLPLLALLACAGDPSDGAASLPADSRADIYNANAATATAVDLVNAIDQGLVDFDPTINPAQSAEQNAMNIAARVRGAASCASATVSGATVTAQFNACALPSGVSLNGQVTVAVTKSGGTITLAFTLANLSVNGKTVNGSLTLVTTTGTSFTASGSFTAATAAGTNAVALNSLVITATTGQYTLSGMLTSTVNGAATSVGIAANNPLVYQQGNCYPRGGTAIAARGSQRYTVVFDTVTATCGSVNVRVNNLPPVRVSLPAYGTCPSGTTCPPAITVSELLRS